MQYAEYIQIKNMLNLCSFYGEPFFRKNGGDDMWISRTIMLVQAMCELENEGQYPTSSSFADLFRFCAKTPDAVKLNHYLTTLPGFNPQLGANQTHTTFTQHGFIDMNLEPLRTEKVNEIESKCSIRLSGLYKLRRDETGAYLTVELDDTTVNVEKRMEFREKTFKVNGVIVDDLEFHDLVNMISYTNYVKNVTKQNIEAVYYLLR